MLAQEVRHADGKTERVFGDGRREVAFANGTLRRQLPDGRALVRFTNGDVKKTFPCGAPPHAHPWGREPRTVQDVETLNPKSCRAMRKGCARPTHPARAAGHGGHACHCRK